MLVWQWFLIFSFTPWGWSWSFSLLLRVVRLTAFVVLPYLPSREFSKVWFVRCSCKCKAELEIRLLTSLRLVVPEMMAWPSRPATSQASSPTLPLYSSTGTGHRWFSMVRYSNTCSLPHWSSFFICSSMQAQEGAEGGWGAVALWVTDDT